jgi:hypothetical protein
VPNPVVDIRPVHAVSKIKWMLLKYMSATK